MVPVSVNPLAMNTAIAFVKAVSARRKYNVWGPKLPGPSRYWVGSGISTGITDWQKFSPSSRFAKPAYR